jgi:hypothetical protein
MSGVSGEDVASRCAIRSSWFRWPCLTPKGRSVSSIVWRRGPLAKDWLDPQSIKDQDAGYVYSASDTAGNVMLVWTNPLGVWASRFE